MNYSIEKITKIIKGERLSSPLFHPTIQHLSLDSRQIIFPQNSAFIAIVGEQQDGHKYLSDVYSSGVRCMIVSQKVDASLFEGASLIYVKNTLVALQQLAAFHRAQFSFPIIGITGSNGKTVIKEWLFQLLRKRYNIVRSPKSYNSQVGVPLSILGIEKEHDLGIFEAGISLPKEMAHLEKIISPTIGIFTNIGAAHDEGFSSREEKIQEKIKLFSQSDLIICEDKYSSYFPKKENQKVVCWGTTKAAILQIKNSQSKEKSTAISAFYTKNKTVISIDLPFSDAASIENALHCWLLLLCLGIDNEDIKPLFLRLEPVAMRLELKQGIQQSLLINDSYNSDLTSLAIALRFLEQQSKLPNRVVILSDILQSGKSRQELYQNVAELLSKHQISQLVGIGKEVAILDKFLDKKIAAKYYPNTNDFLSKLEVSSFRDSTILLKGARRFLFEKIATRLEQKTHNTVLEVNLNALLHNLNVYRSYLQSDTKILVMVKASAYGSGSIEVAKLLEYQKVDYLGVAYTDEGVELRKGGIQTPILVLNTEESSFENLLQYNLEPELYSLSQLRSLERFMVAHFNQKIKIHLKLETGMNRLGFEDEEMEEVGRILAKNTQIHVQSAFSHLAGSEASKHDGFSKKQVLRFNEKYKTLCKHLLYKPFRHILNSSGINRFSEYQMDMVRLGIGIYGVDSSQEISAHLRVVNTLKATISQIKTLKKGDTVGYGRYGKIHTPKRSATISIGYADGLLRQAGKGNFNVLVQGQKAPIIGNVCMDMCMIDITQIPSAKEGDEVIIFGEQPKVEDLAKALGTITYEVFTGVSERVKRVYIQE